VRSGWPHPVVATGWPRTTWSPLWTSSDVSHDAVLVTPPPWSMVRKSLPPTGPAKDTTPSSGAVTVVPTGAAISIPRWPAPYGESGGSNPRTTGPTTGHDHGTDAPAGAIVASTNAGAATITAASDALRTVRRYAGPTTRRVIERTPRRRSRYSYSVI
jgi:hypothetical protein